MLSGEYDSTADTKRHAARVGELLAVVVSDLENRAAVHDASKLQPPELAIFNEYTPKLKNSTYGSPEYRGFLEGMGEGLRHHYATNRHHPEHFPDGVSGMTLVDLIEMFMDWKAASERHDNGDIERSIFINAERFHMDDALVRVLRNTAVALGWIS